MAVNVNVGANTGPLDRDVRKAIDRINKSGALKIRMDDKGVTQPLGNMKRSADEFTKSLEASNARVLAFGASVGIINAVSNAFKGLVKSTMEVQKNLTDINIVMGLSNKELDKFGGGLFKVAAETGAGFQEASKAATEFARQGLSLNETLKRTKDALILTRLTGMDAADSVRSLTAAMNTFGGQVENSTQLVSKFAAVDVKFAVSAKDFAEAIARAGQSAKSAGVDLDSFIGMVTAVQEKTARGGAVAGNAFKTIFTRVHRPVTLQAMENLGVAVKDLNGNVLDADKILSNLSKRWDNLTTSQKANIGQTTAGMFQINILKAILEDMGEANSRWAQATKISSAATDESNRKNEQLRQTMSALATETGVAIEQLAQTIGDLALAPGINRVLESLKSITDWLNKTLGGGEDEGNKFAKGLVAGMGNFLSGPGLVMIAAVMGKLFVNAVKYGAQSLQSLLNINKAAAKRKGIEQSIMTVLTQNSKLQKEMLSTKLTQEKKEAIILNLIKQQTVEAAKLQAVARSMVTPLVRAGVGPNLSAGKARGHVPNFADPEQAAARKSGYAPGGVRQRNIPGAGRVTYNSAETVRNFAGLSQPAIMPPAGSRAGANYQRAFAGAHGFDPYAARGYVPNYALLGRPSLTIGKNPEVNTLGEAAAAGYSSKQLKQHFGKNAVDNHFRSQQLGGYVNKNQSYLYGHGKKMTSRKAGTLDVSREYAMLVPSLRSDTTALFKPGSRGLYGAHKGVALRGQGPGQSVYGVGTTSLPALKFNILGIDPAAVDDKTSPLQKGGISTDKILKGLSRQGYAGLGAGIANSLKVGKKPPVGMNKIVRAMNKSSSGAQGALNSVAGALFEAAINSRLGIHGGATGSIVGPGGKSYFAGGDFDAKRGNIKDLTALFGPHMQPNMLADYKNSASSDNRNSFAKKVLQDIMYKTPGRMGLSGKVGWKKNPKGGGTVGFLPDGQKAKALGHVPNFASLSAGLAQSRTDKHLDDYLKHRGKYGGLDVTNMSEYNSAPGWQQRDLRSSARSWDPSEWSGSGGSYGQHNRAMSLEDAMADEAMDAVNIGGVVIEGKDGESFEDGVKTRNVTLQPGGGSGQMRKHIKAIRHAAASGKPYKVLNAGHIVGHRVPSILVKAKAMVDRMRAKENIPIMRAMGVIDPRYLEKDVADMKGSTRLGFTKWGKIPKGSSGKEFYQKGDTKKLHASLKKLGVKKDKGGFYKRGQVQLSSLFPAGFADGFIPNFAQEGLGGAVGREENALRGRGLPVSAVRVGQRKALETAGNPSGLGVTNTFDEPNGLSDLFAARGAIPNYAVTVGGDSFSGFKNTMGTWQKTHSNLQRHLKSMATRVAKGNMSQDALKQAMDRVKVKYGVQSGTMTKLNAAMQKEIIDKKKAVKPAGFRAGFGGGMSGDQAAAGSTRGGRFGNMLGRFQGGKGGRAGFLGGHMTGMGGMMGMMALSTASGMMSQSMDPKGTSKAVQGASGALSGASTGAMMGSMFGPLGMAIGGAAGALWGLASGFDKAKEALAAKAAEERRVTAELTKVSLWAAVKDDVNKDMSIRRERGSTTSSSNWGKGWKNYRERVTVGADEKNTGTTYTKTSHKKQSIYGSSGDVGFDLRAAIIRYSLGMKASDIVGREMRGEGGVEPGKGGGVGSIETLLDYYRGISEVARLHGQSDLKLRGSQVIDSLVDINSVLDMEASAAKARSKVLRSAKIYNSGNRSGDWVTDQDREDAADKRAKTAALHNTFIQEAKYQLADFYSNNADEVFKVTDKEGAEVKRTGAQIAERMRTGSIKEAGFNKEVSSAMEAVKGFRDQIKRDQAEQRGTLLKKVSWEKGALIARSNVERKLQGLRKDNINSLSSYGYTLKLSGEMLSEQTKVSIKTSQDRAKAELKYQTSMSKAQLKAKEDIIKFIQSDGSGIGEELESVLVTKFSDDKSAKALQKEFGLDDLAVQFFKQGKIAEGAANMSVGQFDQFLDKLQKGAAVYGTEIDTLFEGMRKRRGVDEEVIENEKILANLRIDNANVVNRILARQRDALASIERSMDALAKRNEHANLQNETYTNRIVGQSNLALARRGGGTKAEQFSHERMKDSLAYRLELSKRTKDQNEEGAKFFTKDKFFKSMMSETLKANVRGAKDPEERTKIFEDAANEFYKSWTKFHGADVSAKSRRMFERAAVKAGMPDADLTRWASKTQGKGSMVSKDIMDQLNRMERLETNFEASVKTTVRGSLESRVRDVLGNRPTEEGGNFWDSMQARPGLMSRGAAFEKGVVWDPGMNETIDGGARRKTTWEEKVELGVPIDLQSDKTSEHYRQKSALMAGLKEIGEGTGSDFFDRVKDTNNYEEWDWQMKTLGRLQEEQEEILSRPPKRRAREDLASFTIRAEKRKKAIERNQEDIIAAVEAERRAWEDLASFTIRDVAADTAKAYGTPQERLAAYQGAEQALVGLIKKNDDILVSEQGINEKIKDKKEAYEVMNDIHDATNQKLKEQFEYAQKIAQATREYKTGANAFHNGMSDAFKAASDRAENFRYEMGKAIPEAFSQNMSNAMMKLIRDGGKFKDALLDGAIGFLDAINQKFMSHFADQFMASFYNPVEQSPETLEIQNANLKLLSLGDAAGTAGIKLGMFGDAVSGLISRIENLNIETPDPKPDPKPGPKPDPKPDPKGVWSKMWGGVKNLFGFNKGGQVPTMLSNGEYVMGRNAVGRIGASGMDALNRGILPGRAGGGLAHKKKEPTIADIFKRPLNRGKSRISGDYAAGGTSIAEIFSFPSAKKKEPTLADIFSQPIQKAPLSFYGGKRGAPGKLPKRFEAKLKRLKAGNPTLEDVFRMGVPFEKRSAGGMMGGIGTAVMQHWLEGKRDKKKDEWEERPDDYFQKNPAYKKYNMSSRFMQTDRRVGEEVSERREKKEKALQEWIAKKNKQQALGRQIVSLVGNAALSGLSKKLSQTEEEGGWLAKGDKSFFNRVDEGIGLQKGFAKIAKWGTNRQISKAKIAKWDANRQISKGYDGTSSLADMEAFDQAGVNQIRAQEVLDQAGVNQIRAQEVLDGTGKSWAKGFGSWVANPPWSKVKDKFGGHASGGPITGTPGIDQIPAMLTEGEYVINANAARKIGRGNLDKINSARKFNEGGLVGDKTDDISGGSSSSNTNNISITVNVKGDSESAGKGGDDNKDNKNEMMDKFSQKIKQQVVTVIREENRPGGLLRS